MSASPDIWPQSPLPPSRLPAAALAVPLARPAAGDGLMETDGELLRLFTRHGETAAFDKLVERHSAMVWRVCRQSLRRRQDAEDAFQATFLLLVKSARQIGASESAAGWLFRVAYRTSLRARKRLASRREEALALDPTAPSEIPFPDLTTRQHMGVLAEELMELPLRYQTPLVMRYIEGQSRRAIAEATDVTVATVQGRLARGKQLLRRRLVRRGVSLSVAVGVLSSNPRAEAAVASTHLLLQTTTSAVSLATGGSLAASTAVILLLEQGTRAMLFASLTKPMAVGAACGLAALVLAAPPVETTTTTSSDGVVLSAAVGGDDAETPTATLQLTADEPTSDREPEALAPGAEAGKKSVVVREVYLFENLVNALKEKDANKSDRAHLESLAVEISHAVGIKLDSIDIVDSNKSLVVSADQPTRERLAAYLKKVRSEENVAKYVAKVLSEDRLKPTDGEPVASAPPTERVVEASEEIAKLESQLQQVNELTKYGFEQIEKANELFMSERNPQRLLQQVPLPDSRPTPSWAEVQAMAKPGRLEASLWEKGNKALAEAAVALEELEQKSESLKESIEGADSKFDQVEELTSLVLGIRQMPLIPVADDRDVEEAFRVFWMQQLAQAMEWHIRQVAAPLPNPPKAPGFGGVPIGDEIRRLQASLEIEPTGELDEATWNHLFDVAKKNGSQRNGEPEASATGVAAADESSSDSALLKALVEDEAGPRLTRDAALELIRLTKADQLGLSLGQAQSAARIFASLRDNTALQPGQSGIKRDALLFRTAAGNAWTNPDIKPSEAQRKPLDPQASQALIAAMADNAKQMHERAEAAKAKGDTKAYQDAIEIARRSDDEVQRREQMLVESRGEPEASAPGVEVANESPAVTATLQQSDPSLDLRFGDMALNGRKLSDAEQNELLRKQWAEAAKKDPPPSDGEPSFKELHTWHTYWEHQYDALRSQLKAMTAANERTPGAVPEKEVQTVGADIFKARAEALRYERELKLRALKTLERIPAPSLRPGDQLSFSTWGAGPESRNGVSGPIGPDGTFDFGSFKAEGIAGKTPNEAQEIIADQLRKHLNDPTVQVRIGESVPQTREAVELDWKTLTLNGLMNPSVYGLSRDDAEWFREEVMPNRHDSLRATIKINPYADAPEIWEAWVDREPADKEREIRVIAAMIRNREARGGTAGSSNSGARVPASALLDEPAVPPAAPPGVKFREAAPQRVAAFEAVRVPAPPTDPAAPQDAAPPQRVEFQAMPDAPPLDIQKPNTQMVEQSAASAVLMKEQLAAFERAAEELRSGDDRDKPATQQVLAQLEAMQGQMRAQLQLLQAEGKDRKAPPAISFKAVEMPRELREKARESYEEATISPPPVPFEVIDAAEKVQEDERVKTLTSKFIEVSELETLRQQNEVLRAELDVMRKQIEKSSFAFADARAQWQGPTNWTSPQSFAVLLPLDKSGRPGKYAGANQQYGFSVQQLQQRLNEVLDPSPKLDIDGDYGPQTVAAVKRFQKVSRWPVTGFADESTRRAMGLLEVAPAPQATTIESNPWNRTDVTTARNGLKPIRRVFEATVAPAAPPVSAVPSLPAAPASPLVKPSPIPTPSVPNAPPVTPPSAEVEESGDAETYFNAPPLFTPRKSAGIALVPPKPDGARIKYAKRNSEYGWSVLQLQERLNEVLKPTTPLRVDGDYGPLTEAAVKEFQKVRELPVTGDVDARTRAALGFVEPEGTFEPADRIEAYRTQINKNLDQAENSLRQLINIAKHANDIRKMHAPKPPKHGEVVPSALIKAAIGQRDFIFSKTDAANSMVNEVRYGASFRDNPDAITVESKLTKEAADFVAHLERLELINHYTNAAYQSLFDAALAKDKYSFDIEEFDPEKLVDWASSRVRREGAKESVVSIGEKK